MTQDREELADRLRIALAGEPTLRETAMFGGRAFLLSDKMVASAMKAGELLVRVADDRTTELLQRSGTSVLEMRPGRPMGRGWILVDSALAKDDDELAFWLAEALAHNRTLR